MAAMKRERQYDMFDVVTGVCELDNYLNQRYSENDLQSKFWVESSDTVDELRPAKGGKGQVVIPVQGPNAPIKNVAASTGEAGQLPSRPPWEADPLPSKPPWESSLPAATAPGQPADRSAPRQPEAAPQASQPAQTSSPSAAPVQAPPPQRPVTQAYTPAPPDASQRAERPAFASPTPEASAAPAPPSMAELLAQFHQATKAYEERAQDDEEPES